MKMTDLIVKGGAVVAVDRKRKVIENRAIAISKNKIEFVGRRKEAEKRFEPEATVGAEGKIIFLGLVNAHEHMFQVVLRNLAVDVPLLIG
jgi:5-methylthioadenosine/S-adenosylhomocysteine deaminase